MRKPPCVPGPKKIIGSQHTTGPPPRHTYRTTHIQLGYWTISYLSLIGPCSHDMQGVLSNYLFSHIYWLSGLLSYSGNGTIQCTRKQCFFKTQRRDMMRMLIGLVLAGAIGAVVINNLIGLVATIQQTLNTSGL